MLQALSRQLILALWSAQAKQLQEDVWYEISELSKYCCKMYKLAIWNEVNSEGEHRRENSAVLIASSIENHFPCEWLIVVFYAAAAILLCAVAEYAGFRFRSTHPPSCRNCLRLGSHHAVDTDIRIMDKAATIWIDRSGQLNYEGEIMDRLLRKFNERHKWLGAQPQ
jgi:hypothetical protein